MKKRLLPLAALTLLLLSLTGCLGPKPVLQGYKADPPPAGSDKPFTLDATIHNEGPGDGQISVEVTLTDKQSKQTIATDAKNVQLAKDETQHVLFNIDLPPSARNLNPQDIDVEVQAHYPIE